MRKITNLLVIIGLLMFGVLVGSSAQEDEAESITYGEAATGFINNDTPEIPFVFEGTSGDVITITMIGLEPDGANAQRLDSYLTLIGPEGNTLAQDDDSAGNLNSMIGPFTLPQTGQYRVIAARFLGAEGSSAGPFELTIRATAVNPLVLGEAIMVELPDTTIDEFFSYEAAGGEILDFTLLATSGTGFYTLVVTDPDGFWVNQGYSMPTGELLLGPVFITTPGTYTIQLSSELDYDMMGRPIESDEALVVRMIAQALQARPIPVDEMASGNLDDDNPTDYYVFSADQGQVFSLLLRQVGDVQPVDMQVYGPDGFSINGGSTAYLFETDFINIDPVFTNQPGNYVLVLRRASITSEGVAGTTSAYEITLGRTQLPEVQDGVEVSEAFDPFSVVYEYAYRYAGTRGETIRITLRSLNDVYGPVMSVQGPGDNFNPFNVYMSSSRPGSLIFELTLDESGDYIFRVNNGFYGDYNDLMPKFGLLIESIGQG